MLALLLGWTGTGANAADPEIVITHTPPVVLHRTFDPAKPPADMPVLVPPEIGLCVSQFGCEVRLWTMSPEGRPVTTMVDGVEVTTRLQITIWTRENAPDGERIHEEGHRTISEYYYEAAKTVAQRLAEAVVGQRLLELVDTGTRAAGVDPITIAGDAVRDRMIEEYLAKTHWRAAFAQQVFDDLTDHGRNDVAVSTAITEAIAEEQGNHAGKRHPSD